MPAMEDDPVLRFDQVIADGFDPHNAVDDAGNHTTPAATVLQRSRIKACAAAMDQVQRVQSGEIRDRVKGMLERHLDRLEEEGH
jgi:hypothetical protein